MTITYNDAFDLVVGHEGGFTTDPNDRGNWTTGVISKGKNKGTKYGISAMAYPDLDIKNLTLQDARDIYRMDYWNKCRCDDLPSPLNYLVFDAAVNHGVSRAGKFLQTTIGVTADGVIGPKTTLTASRVLDLSKAASEFCVTRALFYTEIGTFQRYKKGWFRRLFEVHSVSLSDLLEDNASENCTLAIAETQPKAAVDVAETEAEAAFWKSLTEDLQGLAEKATERAQRLAP